jgi:hypothetical protein
VSGIFDPDLHKAEYGMELFDGLLPSPSFFCDPLHLGLSVIRLWVKTGVQEDPLEIGRISVGNNFTVG